MQTAVLPGEALDGGDLCAVLGDGEQQAAVEAPAVDEDGARPALAVVAALLRAGEAEPLAQRVEQGRAVVQVERVPFAVDVERDLRVRGLLAVHDEAPASPRGSS
ncbi:hypothetical protein Slala02_48570 [Streptomyces lavendulae subsp. lavendulae]|nr:hypothetical protein Slala01_52640 [Streptomyces lavendulae subsp. lavendulae]GLX29037.1 hypothetical protein Slala02_48570 [Streptomyces lavendulae subsp. lavendulae]